MPSTICVCVLLLLFGYVRSVVCTLSYNVYIALWLCVAFLNHSVCVCVWYCMLHVYMRLGTGCIHSTIANVCFDSLSEHTLATGRPVCWVLCDGLLQLVSVQGVCL